MLHPSAAGAKKSGAQSREDSSDEDSDVPLAARIETGVKKDGGKKRAEETGRSRDGAEDVRPKKKKFKEASNAPSPEKERTQGGNKGGDKGVLKKEDARREKQRGAGGLKRDTGGGPGVALKEDKDRFWYGHICLVTPRFVWVGDWEG